MHSKLSRRQYLQKLATLATIVPLNSALVSLPLFKSSGYTKRDIHIFSKHLQWLDYNQMALTGAQMGFDGIDLTVRPNGHVLPANVTTDLPKAVKAIREAGLKSDLITTTITSVHEPNTVTILKTASQLGIKTYRLGWLTYNPNKPIPLQLDQYKKQLAELVTLNKIYGIQAAYQNHAGTGVGASLWDIWYMIKDMDPKYIGIQFDIRHAMIESFNSWPTSLKLIAPHINSLVIKDFNWTKIDGKMSVNNVPIGQGVIDFQNYFKQLDELKIKAPLCLHSEYPLGGANDGAFNIAIPAQDVTNAIKSDLLNLKKTL